jgi:hypothetical protein
VQGGVDIFGLQKLTSSQSVHEPKVEFVIITMFFETLAPASKRALTVSTDEWTPIWVSAKMARCKGGSTEIRVIW